MFVDNVFGIGEYNLAKWLDFSQILAMFSSSSSLLINKEKSYLIAYHVEDIEVKIIVYLLGIKFKPLPKGFKYFGFYHKTYNYRRSDWNRILKKFERKLSRWENKWLSLGGRMIMNKAVLQ